MSIRIFKIVAYALFWWTNQCPGQFIGFKANFASSMSKENIFSYKHAMIHKSQATYFTRVVPKVIHCAHAGKNTGWKLGFVGQQCVVWTVMLGLYSRWRHSSRLLPRCERDTVRTNVDIHTLVGELRDKVERSFNNKARYLRPLTRVWFTNMFPRASRRDKNWLRTWQTRRIYPSHSPSHLMLFQRECKPSIMHRMW